VTGPVETVYYSTKID